MKVGHIIDGLEVVDVKRVNKMNLIQFTKAVSEYIEQGYKLDVHSSRQVGLVLMVDLFKTEEPKVVEGVGSTEDVINKSPELTAEAHSDVMLPVLEPNETTIEAIQESTEKLEAVETSDEVVNEQPEQGEETTPPVKKTRTKKTT